MSRPVSLQGHNAHTAVPRSGTGLHTHDGIRILRDVAELGRAGGNEQLRDLLALQIFRDRGVVRRAHGREDERHLVALDQPPGLLDRLRRHVAVVERDQVDLTAVDAALRVDHPEIGCLTLAENAKGGDRPAIGHGLADLDFGGGDAGLIGCCGSALQGEARNGHGCCRHHATRGDSCGENHHGPP